jgi:hypothetical protein
MDSTARKQMVIVWLQDKKGSMKWNIEAKGFVDFV